MTIDELAKTTGLSEEIKTYLKKLQKNESISFAEAVNESVLYITEQTEEHIESVIDDYRSGKFDGKYIIPGNSRDKFFEVQGMNKMLTQLLNSLNSDLIKDLKKDPKNEHN